MGGGELWSTGAYIQIGPQKWQQIKYATVSYFSDFRATDWYNDLCHFHNQSQTISVGIPVLRFECKIIKWDAVFNFLASTSILCVISWGWGFHFVKQKSFPVGF